MDRYSETVMEHFLDPQNRGVLVSPSGVGVSGVPGEGPFLVFQIICTASSVSSASFQCHNCGVTVASGSMLTKMLLGKTLEECRPNSAEDIIAALGGIPPDKQHATQFALLAMRQAVEDAAG